MDAQAQIHHIAGSSSDLVNLQAVCRRCNMADAQSKFTPVGPGLPEAELAMELEMRWSSATPLRPCDDDVSWKVRWRALHREAPAAIQGETPSTERRRAP